MPGILDLLRTYTAHHTRFIEKIYCPLYWIYWEHILPTIPDLLRRYSARYIGFIENIYCPPYQIYWENILPAILDLLRVILPTRPDLLRKYTARYIGYIENIYCPPNGYIENISSLKAAAAILDLFRTIYFPPTELLHRVNTKHLCSVALHIDQ